MPAGLAKRCCAAQTGPPGVCVCVCVSACVCVSCAPTLRRWHVSTVLKCVASVCVCVCVCVCDITQAFNEIVQCEVTRLKMAAWRRLQTQWRRHQRAAEVRTQILIGASTRALRHWRTLTHFRRQRRSRREAALAVATARRKRRMLSAWQVVAAAAAEQARLVALGRARAARRCAVRALAALRENVLDAAEMRALELCAAQHWETARRKQAMAGWKARTRMWRMKRARWDRAARHHTHRLMDIGLTGFLLQWQRHQVRTHTHTHKHTHASLPSCPLFASKPTCK